MRNDFLGDDNDAVVFTGARGIAVLQRLLGIGKRRRRVHRLHSISGVVPFGVEPTDTIELLRLRAAIDDLLPFPTEDAEQDGDYHGALAFTASELARLKLQVAELTVALNDRTVTERAITRKVLDYARKQVLAEITAATSEGTTGSPAADAAGTERTAGSPVVPSGPPLRRPHRSSEDPPVAPCERALGETAEPSSCPE